MKTTTNTSDTGLVPETVNSRINDADLRAVHRAVLVVPADAPGAYAVRVEYLRKKDGAVWRRFDLPALPSIELAAAAAATLRAFSIESAKPVPPEELLTHKARLEAREALIARRKAAAPYSRLTPPVPVPAH